MSTKPSAICMSVLAWMKDKKGKACFAPFTGQDMAAWSTFVHAVALWGRADDEGREGARQAMRGAVLAMQPHLRHLARDAIPAVLDYGYLAKIWRLLGTDLPCVDSDSPPEHRAAVGAS